MLCGVVSEYWECIASTLPQLAHSCALSVCLQSTSISLCTSVPFDVAVQCVRGCASERTLWNDECVYVFEISVVKYVGHVRTQQDTGRIQLGYMLCMLLPQCLLMALYLRIPLWLALHCVSRLTYRPYEEIVILNACLRHVTWVEMDSRPIKVVPGLELVSLEIDLEIGWC